jgi:hypothetical protein
MRGFAIFDDGTAGGPIRAIGNFTTAGGVPSSPIADAGCAAGATSARRRRDDDVPVWHDARTTW